MRQWRCRRTSLLMERRRMLDPTRPIQKQFAVRRRLGGDSRLERCFFKLRSTFSRMKSVLSSSYNLERAFQIRLLFHKSEIILISLFNAMGPHPDRVCLTGQTPIGPQCLIFGRKMMTNLMILTIWAQSRRSKKPIYPLVYEKRAILNGSGKTRFDPTIKPQKKEKPQCDAAAALVLVFTLGRNMMKQARTLLSR